MAEAFNDTYLREPDYSNVDTYDEFVSAVKRGRKSIECWHFVSSAQVACVEPLLKAVRDAEIVGLQLCSCFLKEADWKFFIQRLKDVWSSLQELCFYRTTLGESGLSLDSVITPNSPLRALELRYSNISDSTRLTESMATNTTLKYLTLSYTSISESDSLAFAQGLKENTCLEVLRLYALDLQDSAAVALAEALETNTQLLHLSLGKNRFTNKAGTAIANSLTKNATLRKLSLNNNFLDNVGACAIADALGVGGNRTLEDLWLKNNKIKYEGLASLEKVMSVNNSIESISIRENSASCVLIQQKINRVLDLRKQKRKERRLQAFERAKGSDATTPWLRSKLMVVGRGAAGKTNTVRSLLGLQFNPEWDSTVGIDLTEATTTSGARWKQEQDKNFALSFVHRLAAESIDDTEEVPVLKPPDIKKDQTNQAPELSKVTAVSEVQQTSTEEQEAPLTGILSSGNAKAKDNDSPYRYKNDLFLNQHNAKDAIRMSIWDYGGQKVFNTLHHLFLTQFGVYLIVFDMPKLLESPEESSDYLTFWLNSIKLHAPTAPVLLVGTFLDSFTNVKSASEHRANHKSNKKLHEIAVMLNKLSAGFNQVCSFDDFVYCPTSNKDKSGIQELRNAIERETKTADFVQTAVSLKWMRALDILTQSDKRAYVRVAELIVELQSIGIERDEELERMLKLFHELGVVLYFSSSIQLKEVVISKPEWLLDHISLVIRDKDVHDYDTNKIIEVQLSDDLERFLEHGIASRDLLEFLWNGSQVDYLVDLMRHLLLLSNWSFATEEEFLIPSMLSAVVEEPNIISGVQFYCEFTFLPQGVFERICCLCVGYSASLAHTSLPNLFKNACKVDLGEKGDMHVGVDESSIIRVTLSQASEAGVILDFFLSIMRRIQHDFMHGGLEWQVWLGTGDKFVTHQSAKTQKLEPWVGKKEFNDTGASAAIDKFLDI